MFYLVILSGLGELGGEMIPDDWVSFGTDGTLASGAEAASFRK